MLGALMRTRHGGRFIEFMRSERGKAIDGWLVKNFGFSLLMKVFSARGGFPPIPVLILHTTGRKSGERRSAVMPYFEMDGNYYLIGANGAKKNDPSWALNIRANSEVDIDVNRRRIALHARELAPGSEERARVWTLAATKTPQYNIYDAQSDRIFPVISLESRPKSHRFVEVEGGRRRIDGVL